MKSAIGTRWERKGETKRTRNKFLRADAIWCISPQVKDSLEVLELLTNCQMKPLSSDCPTANSGLIHSKGFFRQFATYALTNIQTGWRHNGMLSALRLTYCSWPSGIPHLMSPSDYSASSSFQRRKTQNNPLERLIREAFHRKTAGLEAGNSPKSRSNFPNRAYERRVFRARFAHSMGIKCIVF